MNLVALTRSRICWLLAILPLAALAADTLPEPLTFEVALATASNERHHDLNALEQRLAALRAELGIKKGEYGFSLDFRGRLREVGVSRAAIPGDEGGDNAASLVLSRPLFDFGLQDSREHHLVLQLQAFEQQKLLSIEQRRLAIMQQYFAVLNADNEFISENEALAIGFIRYDNAVQDQELGLVPEIEVLRLQTEYERIRQKRSLAVHSQRLTRAMLVEAMGFPGQLPSDLEIPDIEMERPLPDDVELLVERAMTHSLETRLANANARAAQAAIGIAETNNNPSLDLEFEVSSYERDSRMRDDWRASLYLEIPIYSAASSGKVDLAQARHRLALADQQQTQSYLRLEVLKLWQEIQQLRLELAGKSVERDYRDRYLDRSRAEYELEFKTDLGDSMVLFSRSNTERLRSLYAFEHAYQRLAALVGTEFLKQSASAQ